MEERFGQVLRQPESGKQPLLTHKYFINLTLPLAHHTPTSSTQVKGVQGKYGEPPLVGS